MKKKSKKYFQREADKFWKSTILKIAQGKCFVCGSKFIADAHHFIPRRISLALRYDLENGICLCRKCHTSLHWKSDPMINLIIAMKKGKKWVEYLQEKKKQRIIPSVKWYQKQVNLLKNYE